MHRLLLGLVLTLTSAGVAVLAPAASAGADDHRLAPVSAAVESARAALTGRSGRDATSALTGLRLAYPGLSSSARAAADALLARPTDGPADPEQFGYSVAEAAPVCGAHFCVHYVPTSTDAPSLTDVDADGVPDWVQTTLTQLEAVLTFESGTLGYRPPPTDGVRGGNPLFDVYLTQLGDDGLYGFCAPESKAPGERYVYSSYCVLDNDFSEYPLGPDASLAATAAHEFFHAIQFGYDATEDRWLLEATATWMEERYADPVNDNRQYLPYGQVGQPGIPLDTFNPSGLTHYGNWAFWEFVTRRYGNGVVKAVWNKAGAFKGAPNMYSTKALRTVLRGRGGFPNVFRAYAAANVIANRAYAEGKAWPAAKLNRVFTLHKNSRRAGASTRIHHMAANHYVLRPGKSLKGKRWKLRVVVDAPNRKAGGAAYLIVKKRHGGWIKKPIQLTRKGIGSAKFTFARSTVQSAIVTLVNANTGFRCWKDNPYFSCAGNPTGDNRLFKLKAQVLKR